MDRVWELREQAIEPRLRRGSSQRHEVPTDEDLQNFRYAEMRTEEQEHSLTVENPSVRNIGQSETPWLDIEKILEDVLAPEPVTTEAMSRRLVSSAGVNYDDGLAQQIDDFIDKLSGRTSKPSPREIHANNNQTLYYSGSTPTGIPRSTAIPRPLSDQDQRRFDQYLKDAAERESQFRAEISSEHEQRRRATRVRSEGTLAGNEESGNERLRDTQMLEWLCRHGGIG